MKVRSHIDEASDVIAECQSVKRASRVEAERRRRRDVYGGDLGFSSFEVDEQGGDVGRADPADPAGLAERKRPDALELLAGLGAKLGIA